MPTSVHALGTLAEFKSLFGPEGNAQDALIDRCIDDGSLIIRGDWGRPVVSVGSETEHHPGSSYDGALGCHLFVRVFPIVSIATIHEAGILLVSGTDFLVDKPAGKITRYVDATVAEPVPKAWPTGVRSSKVVYVGGHKDTAGAPSGAEAVPAAVLKVFWDLTRRLYRQRSRGEDSAASISDATGSRTFIDGPAMLMSGERAILSAAGAISPTWSNWTGEVAA